MSISATSSPSGNPQGSGRLETLDGLRGLAALMVVVYHFLARWSERVHGASLYPHGDGFVDAFPFMTRFGEMGVNLFFLISGFVIMLTLQRCRSIVDFIGRRIARLWPVMLVCATMTTLLVNTSGIYARLEGAEYWQVTWLEYVSSIVFFDPQLAGDALGIPNQTWAGGVYWTLFVEVRFYALIALLFWLVPGRSFLWVWAGVQALSTVLLLNSDLNLINLPYTLSLIFQPSQLAWFSLGIVGYNYWKETLSVPIILTGGIATFQLIYVCLVGHNLSLASTPVSDIIALFLTVIPFILFLYKPQVLRPIQNRYMVAVGLASYPLYMFHERVGMIAMTYLADAGFPPLLSLMIVPLLLVGFAIILSKLLEVPGKEAILSVWRPLTKGLDRALPKRGFLYNEKMRERSSAAP